MGMAKRYANQLGLDADLIIKDMRSGDYEHLVQVFDDAFGEFVILER
jgi:hypothetical protein